MASRDIKEDNQGFKESQEPWSGGETESEEEEEVEEQQEELKGCLVKTAEQMWSS